MRHYGMRSLVQDSFYVLEEDGKVIAECLKMELKRRAVTFISLNESSAHMIESKRKRFRLASDQVLRTGSEATTSPRRTSNCFAMSVGNSPRSSARFGLGLLLKYHEAINTPVRP